MRQVPYPTLLYFSVKILISFLGGNKKQFNVKWTWSFSILWLFFSFTTSYSVSSSSSNHILSRRNNVQWCGHYEKMRENGTNERMRANHSCALWLLQQGLHSSKLRQQHCWHTIHSAVLPQWRRLMTKIVTHSLSLLFLFSFSHFHSLLVPLTSTTVIYLALLNLEWKLPLSLSPALASLPSD